MRDPHVCTVATLFLLDDSNELAVCQCNLPVFITMKIR